MVISLKFQHLKRYKDVARLLFKYGRSGLLKQCGMEAESEAGPEAACDPKAEELAADLEKMGPTFIKLGQLLSTRGDMLPPAYTEALARLQNSLEPFPFEDVERIVTEELGIRLSKGFASFDPVPMAAASLAQVHRATLRDGRPVAVKVQRPGIRERITEDLDALAQIARFVQEHSEIGRRYRPAGVLEEFRRSLFRELDYNLEAHNLETLAENLREFDRIVVPRPVADYSSTRVLTMDLIEGTKVTSLHPSVLMELDGHLLGDQLFRAYLKQIFTDGFLHADPHPGNVFLTRDGRLALLDLGMVVRIPPELRRKLFRLILSVSEGQSEEATAAALEIADTTEDYDKAAFEREVVEIVGRNQDAKMEDVELGRVILGTVRSAADCGVRFPTEMSMVGQTLLKLDLVGRTLAPDYRPNDAIRRNALKEMRRGMVNGFSMAKVFQSLTEAKDFVTNLPGRVNRVLDVVADKKLEVKVQAFDEIRLMQGFQKIANRITLGLILASLIVGAALLMRVPTSFEIFGYPGLPFLFFLVAAGGIMMLAGQILFSDEHRRNQKEAGPPR